MNEEIPSRSSIDSTYIWNVQALFPSLKEWNEELNGLVESKKPPFWPTLASYKGTLDSGDQKVKEALLLLFEIGRKIDKLYTYAHLRHDEEITITQNKEAFEKITSLLHAFAEESSWFEPEVLSLPQKVLDEYLKSPLLKEYRFHLEKILHLKPHTLTSEKEELLARSGKALSTASLAFSSLNNADLKFGKILDEKKQEHPLSHGLYQLYLRSPDRTLRENAFKQYHNTFANFENTLGELIHGQVEVHFFEARSRKYSSCLEASLYPKNIPTSVYHSLVSTVKKGLPSLHKYIKLRKKALKVDALHLYDMYVPIISHVEMKMDYDKAEDLVIESVAPLGKEYQEILKNGLKKHKWVDRYENKNKRSGAYSSGCYDSYPYILMNYKGILRDVFTLAHECGHSMQSFLTNASQPFHYSRYPIFVAEVASTFNEELLMDLIVSRVTKKEEKAFLINEKIEDIRGTFFRQTLFAEFELLVHSFVESGVPITPQLLKEEYYKLNLAYFGPDVEVDKEVMIEWARIPHFYYNFYVYQYATGISAALALAEKVLEKKEGAKEAYLAFLKGGGSKYPVDLLKIAGIDITTPAPIEATIRTFDRLVTQLESLIST